MNAGIDFLEFRPSEIAAAVAMCVSGEIQPIDIDKAMSCFIHVEKVNNSGAHRNKNIDMTNLLWKVILTWQKGKNFGDMVIVFIWTNIPLTIHVLVFYLILMTKAHLSKMKKLSCNHTFCLVSINFPFAVAFVFPFAFAFAFY